jgi:hypothetical protein
MMDVHKEYIKGGEIIYSPKVDSLVFYNGKGRVQLWVWLLESPNVRSVDVFWNNYADSLIVPVTPSAGLDSVKIDVPLKEERSYTFYVRTTDIFGNHSLSEMASATMYDSIYASVLTNRGVKSGSQTCGEIEIQWFGITDDYVYSEVRYTDVNDEVQIARVLPNETSTRIPDAKDGSTYTYRSLYVPTNSIDPFYTEWEPIEITPAPCKFDKSSWSVIACSDEQVDDGGGVVVIIDGNYSDGNYWHSHWSGWSQDPPHWAVIDMKIPRTIAQIVTYRRHNTQTVQYYISDTPDTDIALWTKIAEGKYNDSNWEGNRVMTLDVSTAATGRYLMIYLPDSYGWPHIAIIEIDVYGF